MFNWQMNSHNIKIELGSSYDLKVLQPVFFVMALDSECASCQSHDNLDPSEDHHPMQQ